MKTTTYFQNKHVLVLGLAKSGTAAAKLLLKLGANVTVNDRLPIEENIEAQELESLGAHVICGSHPLHLIHGELDYVVKNPGIPYTNPLIEKALQEEIPVITEIELASVISEAEIIGITGSNGKTTTTTYIFEMLKGGKKNPLIAGNIGKVACEVAQKATEDDVLVTELSSFQLMGVKSFKPHISIVLNLVEAHIDYHGSMENYTEAKSQIMKNQTENDYLIYNADDELVLNMVEGGQAKKVPFSLNEIFEEGAYLSRDGWLVVLGERLIHKDDMSLPGDHNVANALAAALAAKLTGATNQQMINTLKTFTGVKHRLQFVDTYKGRSFYNNSKATNVPATITSLKAFTQPVVLIAGGLDRGVTFEGLKPLLKERVKAVVSYGETKEMIAKTAESAGVADIKMTSTLPDAVNVAYNLSGEGDVILLSPACASWDQFKTFEQRGNCFIEAVEMITK
ncbi:UDP-N-acetylmuramoyl-L-alanine--D-glutamate ligase [Bacillus shivajii]|uniref:UDP-N-acetylmuramoyl-L-alanine--D-glutamate ligase n=1 Tax=Bacillus shivajii TaxID=1983719 RepID=UPI001CF9317F|nr:UDP-N-acetylmuramoyl-L-alanine--D-glutamate ligase [Bacillus shivajii]UCZ51826.1 UDP-N-acetylmuramoyl-L-alanine--D-glutamate ligase [Bacillus shivajii]